MFLLIVSAYLIWPTYKVYTLSDDKETELNFDAIKELKEGAINLGLDLQGGMYVLLEADIPILVEKLADKSTEELKDAIYDADKISINNQTNFFNEFLKIANNRSISLKRNYRFLSSISDNESIVNELKVQRDNAIASALEIIRNRID